MWVRLPSLAPFMVSVAKWLRHWIVVPTFVSSSLITHPNDSVVKFGLRPQSAKLFDPILGVSSNLTAVSKYAEVAQQVEHWTENPGLRQFDSDPRRQSVRLYTASKQVARLSVQMSVTAVHRKLCELSVGTTAM